MNRREAKRYVALHLANHVFDVAKALASEFTDERDAVRVEEASLEFADELYRRAGAEEQAAKVDERQLALFEAYGEFPQVAQIPASVRWIDGGAL